MTQIVMIK